MKVFKKLIYSFVVIILVCSIILWILYLLLYTVRFDFDEVTDIVIKVPIVQDEPYEQSLWEWKSYKVSIDEASELINYLDELKFRTYSECEGATISYEVEMNIDGELIKFGEGCTYFHAHVRSKSPNPFQAKYDWREYKRIIQDIIDNN
ncbi:hypothetical protein RJG79_07970 [Mycoplasmatota bacterium WC44]